MARPPRACDETSAGHVFTPSLSTCRLSDTVVFGSTAKSRPQTVTLTLLEISTGEGSHACIKLTTDFSRPIARAWPNVEPSTFPIGQAGCSDRHVRSLLHAPRSQPLTVCQPCCACAPQLRVIVHTSACQQILDSWKILLCRFVRRSSVLPGHNCLSIHGQYFHNVPHGCPPRKHCCVSCPTQPGVHACDAPHQALSFRERPIVSHARVDRSNAHLQCNSRARDSLDV